MTDDDTIGEIASLMGRSPAQVTLRWHLQHGHIVFPKSMNRDRMQQNFELFDFELEPAHVAAIDGLDRGETGRMGPTRTSSTGSPPDLGRWSRKAPWRLSRDLALGFETGLRPSSTSG